MLRIRRDDLDAHRVILVLEGHILLEWAELLEHECEALTRPGVRVALDFSQVFFIGRTGLEVLTRLNRAGGQPWLTELTWPGSPLPSDNEPPSHHDFGPPIASHEPQNSSVLAW